MDKGFLLYSNGEKYLKQAILCAMSLKVTNKNIPVSIITNDKVDTNFENLFDQIIPIPWIDHDDTRYDILNRWKTYHVSPYKYSIVLDVDTLVVENIDHWWNFFKNYDLYFLSKVFTYRKYIVNDNYYRKAFVANKLPNLYTGMYFFQKNDTSKEFFSWLEIVSKNWELFYGQYCKEYYPKKPSMDVSVAIVSKILDIDQFITNKKINFLHFTHMKTKIQGWNTEYESWQDYVGTYLTDDLRLIIGNYLQSGVFHYTEDSFLSDTIFDRYASFLNYKVD